MLTDLQLWSGPRWATGSELLAFCEGVLSASATLRVTQRHEMNMTVHPGAEWLTFLTPARSLWIPRLLPGHPEWRLTSRTLTVTGDVRLQFTGIADILSDLGPVTYATPEGKEITNLRGINLLAAGYLRTFLQPFMERRGIDWITIGGIGGLRSFDMAWEGDSAHAFVDRVATLNASEWQLTPYPEGGGYTLDMPPSVGWLDPPVWVNESVDLVAGTRSQPRSKLATVIRPMGDIPSGSMEPSRYTIEQNSWRVASVGFGNAVYLEAHRGGPGPILENGQFVGPIPGVAPYGYGLLSGGVTREIIATEAPDYVLCNSAIAAEGEDVTFVRLGPSDEPLPLTEIPSPSGIAVAGVVAAPFDSRGKGAANWAPSPLTGAQESLLARIARRDAGTSTTWNFDYIEAGTWDDGSQVAVSGRGGGGEQPGRHVGSTRLDGGQTTPGSDTVEMIDAQSDASLTTRPPAYFFPPPPIPPGWTLDTSTSVGSRPTVLVIPSDERGPLEAEANGDRNYGTTPYGDRFANTRGLTPDDVVYPGDRIIAATGEPMMAIDQHTANGSGVISSLRVVDPPGTPPQWLDGTELTIERPPVPWRGPSALATWVGQYSTDNVLRLTDPILLPWVPPGETIRVRASWALGGWHAATWITGASGSGEVHPPILRLRRTDTDTVVATSTFTTVATAAGEWVDVVLSVTWTSVDPMPPLRIEIVLPGGRSAFLGEQHWHVVPMFMGVSLDYGDPDLPIIQGSEATAMWQDATEILRTSRAWLSTYRIDRAVMADALGLDPETNVLRLGADVILNADSLGSPGYLRVREEMIEEIREDAPRVTTLLLEVEPAKVSTAASTDTPGALYVPVGGENALTTRAPRPTSGAYAAVVPYGQIGILVPVEPIA